MGTRLGEGVADDGQGGHEHDGSDSLCTPVSEMAIRGDGFTYIVPVRAMCGDGDVRDTVVHPMRHWMAVGNDGSVAHGEGTWR